MQTTKREDRSEVKRERTRRRRFSSVGEEKSVDKEEEEDACVWVTGVGMERTIV